MPYRYIEDIAIADIAFEATGKTVEEMFESSALAVEEIMVDFKTLRTGKKRHIKLSAKSVKELLFDFIEELIYLKDAEQLVFKKFDIGIKVGNKCTLVCEAHGDKIDYRKQKLKLDVKAMTHHMFKVENEKGKWKALVVVDI